MLHNVKFLTSNALVCALLCLPAIGSADYRNDQYRTNYDPNASYEDQQQNPQADPNDRSNQTNDRMMQSGYPTPNGELAYSRANWNPSQAASRTDQYQTSYNRNGYNNRQNQNFATGWDSNKNYSRSNLQGSFARGTNVNNNAMNQGWNQNARAARYFPGDSYYSTGYDRSRQGFMSPEERLYGRSYNGSYSYPSYSGYSSGYYSSYYPNNDYSGFNYNNPSYSYDNSSSYDYYPYSQYYNSGNGMGDGSYYNYYR